MKKLILLIILISTTVLAQDSAIKDSDLKVIKKDGKWGYIDKEGDFINR